MESVEFEAHRYLSKIDEGINKGHPLFFFYGKGINDYALFDMNLGIQEFSNTLFLYFYNIQKVDAFAIIKNSKVTFLDKNGKSISSNQALNIQKESTGFGSNMDGLPNESEKDGDKEAESATTGISGFENDLEYIEKNYDKKKIAIYFDEFEWQSGLYGAEQNLELLKRVRSWDKSKKSFVMVSIKEPSLLKEYGFDVEEELSNMIYIGNPSQIEIAKSYRRYIYTIRPDIQILKDDFEDIVSAMQGSKKNLRETIRVLKKILSLVERNGSLKKELFEDAINKSIDEKVTFDDVIMNESTKQDILYKIKTFYTDKENSVKGLIMYGPPGTGKTYIAKAIAHEYKMNYMSPTLADLKGEYIGQTSGKVKRFFDEARANAPTIIFLDEIDTMFTKRSGNDTDSYLKDMVNQFLVEIDGAKTGKQDIFIIGATNRLETIDPAIRSRLSSEFLIDLPDSINRELMFDSKFKEFKLSEQEWKREFIAKTEGMSGRDIDNFSKGIKALNIDEESISKELFYRTLKTLEERFIQDFKRDMNNSIMIKSSISRTLKNVIGYDEVKNELKNELSYILSSTEEKKKMESFNIRPKRGNLLYGPPGNGKTTFAEALAGEHDFYYIKVLSKDFTGYSAIDILKKLELIFSNTIKLSKMTEKQGVVLFFDEVDTLINKQMDSTVRGTLLNFLEDENGIKERNSKIILIAATNFIENLDEASIRDGRFDSKLEIRYPTDSEAIKILKQFFMDDVTIDISALDDEYYKQLHSEFKDKKDEYQDISTVDLQGVKEEIKRQAYFADSSSSDRIVIHPKKELKVSV